MAPILVAVAEIGVIPELLLPILDAGNGNIRLVFFSA
jgi:hypothetical protein